ncbi:MAG: hypothetical protein HRF49_05555 [bacterium]
MLSFGCNRPAGESGGADSSAAADKETEGRIVEIPDVRMAKEISDDLKMLILDDPFGKGIGLRDTLETVLSKLLPGESANNYRNESNILWEVRLENVTWKKAPDAGDPQNLFVVYGTFGATKNAVNQILAQIDKPDAPEHGSFEFIGKLTEKSTLRDIEEIFGQGYINPSPDNTALRISYVIKINPPDEPGRTHAVSLNFLVNNDGGNIRMVQLLRK